MTEKVEPGMVEPDVTDVATQGGALDRRLLLRSLGVVGGMAAWTAPAILFATPAGAVTTYIAQYTVTGSMTGAWVNTTDPALDMGSPGAPAWSTCKPSGWSNGVPSSVTASVTINSGTLESGSVTFTAPSTCRIKEAVATVYRPGASGTANYTCQTAAIPNPTWTGNTATFATLPVATGDFRLAFRFRLECGS